MVTWHYQSCLKCPLWSFTNSVVKYLLKVIFFLSLLQWENSRYWLFFVLFFNMPATRPLKNYTLTDSNGPLSSSYLNAPLRHHLLLWLLKNTKSRQGKADSKSFHTSYPTFCHYKNKSPGMSTYPRVQWGKGRGTHTLFLQAMAQSSWLPPISLHSLTWEWLLWSLLVLWAINLSASAFCSTLKNTAFAGPFTRHKLM